MLLHQCIRLNGLVMEGAHRIFICVCISAKTNCAHRIFICLHSYPPCCNQNRGPVIRAWFWFRLRLLDSSLKMLSLSSSSSFLSPSVSQSPSDSLPLCATTLPLLARQELPASLRTPQNPFHYWRRQEPPASLRIPQNPSDCLPVWRRQGLPVSLRISQNPSHYWRLTSQHKT